MNYQYLKRNNLGNYCRSCLNKMYHLNLETKDCVYMEYKYECRKCKTVQNIVLDIKKMSRYKLLFGRR
ncbi:MAG: hypothetical protein SPF70_08705 [Lachnospiraceae bacterium]|nr:hypothetical protein [Lachnospiraceae bacterium]